MKVITLHRKAHQVKSRLISEVSEVVGTTCHLPLLLSNLIYKLAIVAVC